MKKFKNLSVRLLLQQSQPSFAEGRKLFNSNLSNERGQGLKYKFCSFSNEVLV